MSHGTRTWGPVVGLAGLWLALVVAALALPEDSSARRVATVAASAVPVAIAIWQWSYNHVDRHRLRVNRILLKLRNPESVWSLSASFDVEGSLRATAEEAIDGLVGVKLQRLATAADSTVWQLNGTTVRLSEDEAYDMPGVVLTHVLRLEFPPAPRQHSLWRGVFADVVEPAVEAVERAISPISSKFTVRLEFPRQNPYFGLFVAQVPLADLSRFEVEFFEHAAKERDVVRVRSDEIVLMTETMRAARHLSLRYLDLQPLEAMA